MDILVILFFLSVSCSVVSVTTIGFLVVLAVCFKKNTLNVYVDKFGTVIFWSICSSVFFLVMILVTFVTEVVLKHV